MHSLRFYALVRLTNFIQQNLSKNRSIGSIIILTKYFFISKQPSNVEILTQYSTKSKVDSVLFLTENLTLIHRYTYTCMHFVYIQIQRPTMSYVKLSERNENERPVFSKIDLKFSQNKKPRKWEKRREKKETKRKIHKLSRKFHAI